MGEKLVVGPINQGIRTDRTPFVIDNDSFPVLQNAYQWRGRVKRKRGTALLTRLERYFDSTKSYYNLGALTLTLDANGNGNLFTAFDLQEYGQIVPGTVTLDDTTASVIYTDPSENGTLSPSGTIDYASGEIELGVGAAGDVITAKFDYYPQLPVMGIEDLNLNAAEFPMTLAFDTTYSYMIQNVQPYQSYDVSFYKNPITSTYPGYIQKTSPTPTSWNGQNYQQFWSTNYQQAFWTTNGISIPFSRISIGMQFAPSASIAYVSNTATTLVVTIAGSPLVVGDFVFVNEWTGTNAPSLNFQTGYVTLIAGADITITFPDATIGAGPFVPGIIQYLTNRSDVTKDCLRWYDGDPTNGNPTVPVVNGDLGWVNFAPPISNAVYSIDDEPELQWYLVGARMIVPFKDYLLFFGPVIQTSSANSQVYLQDTVIFSQNGTPYYTASFPATTTNDVITATFTPILTPQQQSAAPNAYFEDVEGFGGYITAGFAQPITTVAPNEDVLIVGFTTKQTRLVFTGNNLIPFNFFVINSELGADSTFSSIIFDRGTLAIGDHGVIMTSQVGAERVDLDIPNQVFQFNSTNNGVERICSQRDWINEWVYFTYLSDQVSYIFPNQTLQYNYRDKSWGIFNECYTTYGSFFQQTGYTWATVGNFFPSWSVWNVPWSDGTSSVEQEKVAGGNQQGFILLRDQGTDEAPSLTITNTPISAVITGATQAASAVLTANNSFVVGESITITGVVGMTQLNGNTYTITAVTPTTITLNVNSTGFTPYISGGLATNLGVFSPNHCLNQGDFIIIDQCIGTIGAALNGRIFEVDNPTQNYFTLASLNPINPVGTYFGGGLITRMYVPFIQTKQFPPAWGIGRKCRIGPQMYLLNSTPMGQIELQIYLSQTGGFETQYNFGPIIPDPASQNNTLIYSDILYTCVESSNLGLTPANTNLQMVTAQNPQQNQIWHRLNTSLIGDTVQLGFSISDFQMQTVLPSGTPIAITGATNAYPCVVTCVNAFSPYQVVQISGVQGMAQLNTPPNLGYSVISSTGTTVTLNVDSSAFGAYTGGGFITATQLPNQFAEVELHGFVIDISQSQLLA